MDKTYNKIIYAGNVLIDLTNDTVTADKLLTGYTAHDDTGAIITGTCKYDADTSDGTARTGEILDTKTAYVNGQKVTGTMPNNGAVTGTIDTVDGEYKIANGYHDGSGVVTLNTTDKSLLVAQNIRQNITILGITGTMSGSESMKAQSATATPSTAQQVIAPTGEYNCLSQVTVNAIPYTETLSSKGGYIVTIAGTATA